MKAIPADIRVQDEIFAGYRYWDDRVLGNLEEKNYDGSFFRVYKDRPLSLYDSLIISKNRWPDKTCLVDDEENEVTVKDFSNLVDGFSVYLQRQFRIKPGQHIGVLLYNSIEYCVCIYALNRLRAVMVPLSTKYRQQEVKALVQKSDLSGIIFHEDFKYWFGSEEEDFFRLSVDMEFIQSLTGLNEELNEKQEETDNAVLMFTSGTTSMSKGVMLKNYNLTHAVCVYQKIFDISENDRTVLPIPAYHITGLIAVIGLFIHSGGCVWIHKYFNAERTLREIKRHNITFFHASPTVFSMLLEKKMDYPDLDSLKILACGSGNMPQTKINELKEWIPSMEFHTVYGLTETSSPAVIYPTDASEGLHRGSAGRVVPGVEIKICGDDGKTVKQGESGIILIKGTLVTAGYYKLDYPKLSDGWLDTGDIGYFDEEAYLYIVDRKKDMINRGGEKICSYDVENEIYGIDGVKEAAVVGIPDDLYGEVPAAMIVPDCDKTLNETDIRNFLKTRLAKYKIPAVIVFSGSLPTTPGMKTDKKKIRQLLKERRNETS